MAETKNETGAVRAETRNVDMSVVTVSSKVLGEVLGITDRTVRHLADEGILVRSRHGKYLLMESVKNYVLTLKAQKSGEHVVSTLDEVLDLKTEQAKHEHVKCLIADVKLALIKGKVHKAEDVERVVTDMFERFKSKMEAMPAKLAKRLEGEDRTEIQKELEREVRGALMELSAYDSKQYLSDDYIEVDEKEVLDWDEEEDEE